MPLNFPDSPTLNQIYTSGSNSWQWDGTVWGALSSSLIIDIGSGGITRTVTNISTTTTAGADASTDYVYNITSGTFTLTMPTAVSNTNRYTIKQSGTGTLTIATTSSQTIDGASTVTINNQYQAIDLVSDGSNWLIN